MIISCYSSRYDCRVRFDRACSGVCDGEHVRSLLVITHTAWGQEGIPPMVRTRGDLGLRFVHLGTAAATHYDDANYDKAKST